MCLTSSAKRVTPEPMPGSPRQGWSLQGRRWSAAFRRRRSCRPAAAHVPLHGHPGLDALTDRLGDQEWMALLEVHHSIVRRAAASFSGYEVKAQGDGFLLVFSDAAQAVLAATGMQREFAAHTRRKPDRPLIVRMGLHTGEVVREGDDFYGRNVIIAARVSATAVGGEVLLTEDVRTELHDAAVATIGECREVSLKGFDERFRVYGLGWEADGP